MAWFQNLAGRAEDLLNKIDQNAATVLNDGVNKSMNKDNFVLVRPDTNILQTENNDFNEETNLSSDLSKLYNLEELPDSGPPSEVLVTDEESSRNCSPRLKTVSSLNSFILTEDVQSYVEKISVLELEVQDLNKQLLNVQHVYAELRNENTTLKAQVETSNYLVTTAQSEMEQYKARAQRILQEKDLFLVKSKNDCDNTKHTNCNDQLKKEMELQQIKNKDLSETIERLTQEMSLLQQQIVLTQKSSQQAIEVLEKNLVTEKKIRVIAEEECRSKNHELHVTRQDLSQQYHILEIKNDEINKLQQALKQKIEVNVNGEYVKRIKTLTDTLMFKQNALETMTTERNALQIQLEKIKDEYNKSLSQHNKVQPCIVNINDTDDVKSQVPHFMRVLPSDAGVTKRVKHAYSTIDAISVKTGIFLRRYPVARVFVFCYMVLLHFWALMLLFLYVPSN